MKVSLTADEPFRAARRDESEDRWLKIGVYLLVECAEKDCVGSTEVDA